MMFNPADDYETLLKQFIKLNMLLKAKESQILHMQKTRYTEDQVRSLQKLLDEERSINEHLTNELERNKII